MKDKLEIYEAAGIPEYWIVDPEHEFASVYTLNKKDKYLSSLPYVDTDLVKSSVLSGFEMDAGLLFRMKYR